MKEEGVTVEEGSFVVVASCAVVNKRSVERNEEANSFETLAMASALVYTSVA